MAPRSVSCLYKGSLKIVYIAVCVCQTGDWWIRKHQWLIERTTEQRAEECESLYGIHMHSASILIRTGPIVFHFHISIWSLKINRVFSTELGLERQHRRQETFYATFVMYTGPVHFL